ncbi:MAG: T9SS type A sorting domain-containing protein [Bacteroidetes bacterium]|nr:T9SS type A sorting domain-containing protein [Bacteroidota bacterium]
MPTCRPGNGQTGISTDIPDSDTQISEFSIYPNPATDVVYVRSQSLLIDEMLRVYDVSGRLVLETKLLSPLQQVSLEALDKGVYFIKINTRLQKILVQ